MSSKRSQVYNGVRDARFVLRGNEKRQRGQIFICPNSN